MNDVPERRSATAERWVPKRAFGGVAWPARLAEPNAPVDVDETEDAYGVEAELSSGKPEDAEKIDARLAGGVRTVRVPKTRRDQPRPVDITAA